MYLTLCFYNCYFRAPSVGTLFDAVALHCIEDRAAPRGMLFLFEAVFTGNRMIEGSYRYLRSTWKQPPLVAQATIWIEYGSMAWKLQDRACVLSSIADYLLHPRLKNLLNRRNAPHHPRLAEVIGLRKQKKSMAQSRPSCLARRNPFSVSGMQRVRVEHGGGQLDSLLWLAFAHLPQQILLR